MPLNELSLSFDAKYKEYVKDNFRTRFSSFMLFVTVGIAGIFGSIYCFCGGFQGAASEFELAAAVVFAIIGVLLIVTSPLSFLFGGTMNRRCKGTISIHFFRPNLELKLWRYELTTNYKKKPLSEHGDIDGVEEKKGYAIIRLDSGKTLHIPYSEMSKEEKENLLTIGKETQEYLREEERKRKEYHSGSNLD